MSLPTLFPLSCDPIQYRIGLAISDHFKSQFDIVESLIIKGDLQTSEFIIDNLQIFIFQSELAYQFEFPLIDSYLVHIRELFNNYNNHSEYYSNRILSFHCLIDGFKSLNEIAFSEVEHIDYSQVEIPFEKSETVIESEKMFNKAQQILNSGWKETIEYSDFFDYVKSLSSSVMDLFHCNKTIIYFNDKSKLLFDHNTNYIEQLTSY